MKSGRPGRPGVGELNLLNLSSAPDRRRDGGGYAKDAIMEVCKTIVTRCTRDAKRRRPDGRLAGNVQFYAVNKAGKFAGGSIYPGGKMAVHDGEQARTVPGDPLLEK